MATSSTESALRARLEDVVPYLPVSRTTEYSKGRLIYGPDERFKSIYLLLAGTVGLSRIAEDNTEVLLEIVRPDELFGESAFLDLPRRPEQATAIENVKLMTFTTSEMENLVRDRPHLAMALLQVLVERNTELTRRIESFSIDTVERRLARSLLRFSERLGTLEDDGSVRMMPFTHLTLSRYVGTTRECVTHYMAQFRKQGYVNYSREGIFVYCDALKASISSLDGVA